MWVLWPPSSSFPYGCEAIQMLVDGGSGGTDGGSAGSGRLRTSRSSSCCTDSCSLSLAVAPPLICRRCHTKFLVVWLELEAIKDLSACLRPGQMISLAPTPPRDAALLSSSSSSDSMG
ncbi:hypothetical protein EYF80_037101 [Liparis tanakae]|uniref:Uncharacterized protein n=1 Tax=Liparis tanakae TaxID=230148 RepID=A0A4Z2GHP8_9TELE|nr:hypothetical protein EYF80_037101 [Liparis tanakae]